MTDDELRAIEERMANASPGPWYGYNNPTDEWWAKQYPGDARFIAYARDDVPALLAEVRRLRGRVAELEAEVEQWQLRLSVAMGKPSERGKEWAERQAARLEAERRWIPVSERLPTRCYPGGFPQWVLTSDGDGAWGVAYYDAGQWHTVGAYGAGLMLARPMRFWQYVEPPKEAGGG